MERELLSVDRAVANEGVPCAASKACGSWWTSDRGHTSRKHIVDQTTGMARECVGVAACYAFVRGFFLTPLVQSATVGCGARVVSL